MKQSDEAIAAGVALAEAVRTLKPHREALTELARWSGMWDSVMPVLEPTLHREQAAVIRKMAALGQAALQLLQADEVQT